MKPQEIHIPPGVNKRAVLDGLLAALDMCGNGIALPIRDYLAGRRSADSLASEIAQHGALAGQLPAKVQQNAGYLQEAVGVGCGHSAFCCTALSALRLESQEWPAVTATAIRFALAAAGVLAGRQVLASLDLMFQRLLLPTPPAPTDDIGRNKPCLCGSGKKWKLCCGRPRPAAAA